MGDPISTWFVKLFFILNGEVLGKVPQPLDKMTGSMLYPYYQIYFTHMFNSKDVYLKDVKEEKSVFKLGSDYTKDTPIFFTYGTEKPVMFHSDEWIENMKKTKNCKIVPLKAGHWLMTDKPKELNEALLNWLSETHSCI